MRLSFYTCRFSEPATWREISARAIAPASESLAGGSQIRESDEMWPDRAGSEHSEFVAGFV